jgi:PAS domain S-box-containing protein
VSGTSDQQADVNFATLFEFAPGCCIVLLPNEQFTVVAVNQAYLRATHTSRGEILGKGLFEIFSSSVYQGASAASANIRASLNTVLSTHEIHTLAVQQYDLPRAGSSSGETEEHYWNITNKPVLNASGATEYILHEIEDLTDFVRLRDYGSQQASLNESLKTQAERMEAEVSAWAQEVHELNRKLLSTNKELRAQEERFRAVLNQSQAFLALISTSGVLLDGNRLALEGTGVTREETIGQLFWETPWWRNLPDEQETIKQDLLSAAKGGATERDIRYQTSVGETRFANCSMTPVMDGAGEVSLVVLLGFDITDRKRAEEAQRRAHEELEIRVAERTAELRQANRSLRELNARLLRLQDEERRRIARELHDSVGQLLAAMSMNISIVSSERGKLGARAAEAVRENGSLVEQMLAEIRTLSYLLHPPLLDEMGLESALNWYVAGFSERSHIQAELKFSEEFGRLSPEMETAIFRIVQECLTNVHRHSGSARATIAVTRKAGEILVEVNDEGSGIPEEKLLQMETGTTTGVGFRGMRERVGELGGNLEVRSGNPGTQIAVRLPVKREGDSPSG